VTWPATRIAVILSTPPLRHFGDAPLAKGEAVFVQRRTVEEVIGCCPAQDLRAGVGESHLDAGMWRKPEEDGMRWTAERGAPVRMR
jgi:hypothetical protein